MSHGRGPTQAVALAQRKCGPEWGRLVPTGLLKVCICGRRGQVVKSAGNHNVFAIVWDGQPTDKREASGADIVLVKIERLAAADMFCSKCTV
jgi:hypothetical protein